MIGIVTYFVGCFVVYLLLVTFVKPYYFDRELEFINDPATILMVSCSWFTLFILIISTPYNSTDYDNTTYEDDRRPPNNQF